MVAVLNPARSVGSWGDSDGEYHEYFPFRNNKPFCVCVLDCTIRLYLAVDFSFDQHKTRSYFRYLPRRYAPVGL